MAWTYGGDPSANNRDEVRYLVGDTDTTDQQVNDAEIAYAIAQEANNTLAAALTAKAIASKYARLMDMSVGDLSKSASARMQHYLDLEKSLIAKSATKSAASPYAGGISIAGKENVEDNSDRVVPRFERGMFNNENDRKDSKDGRYI